MAGLRRLSISRFPRVDFGVSYFPTDEAVEPAVLGQMVEERGFESVFVTEHTHIPASRDTPSPAGGELPREYFRTHDPFIALGAIAAARAVCAGPLLPFLTPGHHPG